MFIYYSSLVLLLPPCPCLGAVKNSEIPLLPDCLITDAQHLGSAFNAGAQTHAALLLSTVNKQEKHGVTEALVHLSSGNLSLSPHSLSQPCHPTGTTEAKEWYLMLFSRAMRGDIVLVRLLNAAAEHFQPPN